MQGTGLFTADPLLVDQTVWTRSNEQLVICLVLVTLVFFHFCFSVGHVFARSIVFHLVSRRSLHASRREVIIHFGIMIGPK